MKCSNTREKTKTNNIKNQRSFRFTKIATLSSLALFSSISVAEPLANGWDINRAGLTGSGFTDSSGRTSIGIYRTNNLGQLAGTSYIYADAGTDFNGYAAWHYDGTSTTQIGFYDAEHTFSTGYVNNYVWDVMDNGFVVGDTEQYRGGTDARTAGMTAWVYNGSTTNRIGFTGGEYTGADGIQNSQINDFSSAGYITGRSDRYNSENRYLDAHAWVSDGVTTTRIGLDGAAYNRTTSGGNYHYSSAGSVNHLGMVAGTTLRWGVGSGGSSQDAWVYNGVSTVQVGLSGAEFTADDGSQVNNVGNQREITASGMTMGSTTRHNGGSAYLGSAAWHFNGATTTRVGLTDAEHTRADDYQSSGGQDLNESGQAVGTSNRYNGADYAGRSAWLYDGTSTTKIGLTDSEHTRNDGYESSSASSINEQGDGVGATKKYDGASDMGQTAWRYDGTDYIELGLIGNIYARDDGYSFTAASFVEGSDTLITGSTDRFNNSGDAGESAWLYNSATDRLFDLTLDVGTGGMASSRIFEVNADGSVLGAYKTLGVGSEKGFYFHEDYGLFDLNDLFEQAGLDLSLLDISSLSYGYGNDVGQIYGRANLIGGGSTTYIVDTGDFTGLVGVSTVPVPAAVWLFGSGLIGLIGIAKRKKTA